MPLMTRLTVFFETPARDATSLMVGFEFSKFRGFDDMIACDNDRLAGQVEGKKLGKFKLASNLKFDLTPVSLIAIIIAGEEIALTVQTNFDAVARTFVDARRNSKVLENYPGSMPTNFVEGYDIQDKAIRMLAKPIGGWKVGRVADRLVAHYGTNRLAGPIFTDMIVDASEGVAAKMPVLLGFAAVEAELMLRIGETPPANANLESIAGCIDEVRFGLEIASSPFPGINDHGPAVTVSDFGNNFGLVLGPKIENWQNRDLANAPVDLQIDDELVGTGTLSTMLDGPFGSAAFLANLLAARGVALTPGTWISTGAITGVHQISPGQSARARFDNEFEVSCSTRLYTPNAQMTEGV